MALAASSYRRSQERYDGWVRREVQDGRYIVQVTLLLEGEHDDD